MVAHNVTESSLEKQSFVSTMKQSFFATDLTRMSVFVTLAFGLSVITFKAVPQLSLWFAIILFLLGTAHGGIEYKNGKISEASGKFYVHYLVLATAFAGFWMISPLISFILFLTASAFHFSQSETHIKSLGVSAILGSLAFYPNQTVGYFAILTQNDAFLTMSQTSLIILGVLALIIPVIEGLYKGRDAVRIMSWIAVACFLPPVEAVALYFFFFHALPEYLKAVPEGRSAQFQHFKPFAITGILSVIGGILSIIAFWFGLVSLYVLAMFAVAFVMPHIIFHAVKDFKA